MGEYLDAVTLVYEKLVYPSALHLPEYGVGWGSKELSGGKYRALNPSCSCKLLPARVYRQDQMLA